MKQEMGSILQLLLPLARDLNSSERSEGEDQRDDLRIMLQQLRGVAEALTQTARTQVSSSLKQAHPTPNGRLRSTAEISHLSKHLRVSELRNYIPVSLSKQKSMHRKMGARNLILHHKRIVM